MSMNNSLLDTSTVPHDASLAATHDMDIDDMPGAMPTNGTHAEGTSSHTHAPTEQSGMGRQSPLPMDESEDTTPNASILGEGGRRNATKRPLSASPQTTPCVSSVSSAIKMLRYCH